MDREDREVTLIENAIKGGLKKSPKIIGSLLSKGKNLIKKGVQAIINRKNKTSEKGQEEGVEKPKKVMAFSEMDKTEGKKKQLSAVIQKGKTEAAKLNQGKTPNPLSQMKTR